MDDVNLQITANALMSKLFYCMDTFDYPPIGKLFCEDGAWLRQGKRNEGPTEIVATLAQRDKNRVTQHAVSNVHAESVGDDRATLRGYMTVFVASQSTIEGPMGPLFAPYAVGHFTGEMQRTPAGWRLAYLQTVPTFAGASQ